MWKTTLCRWSREKTHFMEGRCRRTTSTAWTGLVLIGFSRSTGSATARPVNTSCSMCQLTNDTNLMVTLKGRSFPPSPGRVTSRSTWRGKQGLMLPTHQWQQSLQAPLNITLTNGQTKCEHIYKKYCHTTPVTLTCFLKLNCIFCWSRIHKTPAPKRWCRVLPHQWRRVVD